jgi:hypothetical protein
MKDWIYRHEKSYVPKIRQTGSWYVKITEDENSEELRNNEVARLIKEGYTSGFNPTWSLEITDIEGDIEETTQEEIARLVGEGYTSGLL